MRVLLDTQVWLWMQLRPERLSKEAIALLRDGDNELLLSAASSWEIGIKHALGKLKLPDKPTRYVLRCMERDNITPLAVHHAHGLHVATLPRHHRDPFDRLLIAQAQIERIPIMTADPAFQAYDVRLIAA